MFILDPIYKIFAAVMDFKKEAIWVRRKPSIFPSQN